MDIRATAIPEVKVLTPRRFGDRRGYFCETWSGARMAEAGLDLAFVQDNESLSPRAGTLRGLHYQAPPFAQAKLIRVARVDGDVEDRAAAPLPTGAGSPRSSRRRTARKCLCRRGSCTASSR